MRKIDIPTAVFDYFAADPVGPMWNVGRAANDPTCPIASETNEFLSRIDPQEVAEIRKSPDFRFYARVGTEEARRKRDLDREARAWIVQRVLLSAIASRRLDMLRYGPGSGLARPYDQAALAGITPDDENLVPLWEFDLGESRLVRNGHTFVICNTTVSSNSTYWLLQSCRSDDLHNCARVRLDPLMHSPVGAFYDVAYMMRVYGPPLDWDRVDRLRTTEHGRWRPDERSHESEFTDYVWNPRGDEVHFLCEEVPTVSQSRVEAARYAHAIYVPSRKAISHLDFALRIYTESEVVERHKDHVRRAGRAGWRTKVFRIDRDIPRRLFTTLCNAFFVWNHDVRRYFDEGGTSPSVA